MSTNQAANTSEVKEILGSNCIDGGKCHHQCQNACFRRECCAPFSDYEGPWKYPTQKETK